MGMQWGREEFPSPLEKGFFEPPPTRCFVIHCLATHSSNRGVETKQLEAPSGASVCSLSLYPHFLWKNSIPIYFFGVLQDLSNRLTQNKKTHSCASVFVASICPERDWNWSAPSYQVRLQPQTALTNPKTLSTCLSINKKIKNYPKGKF